MTLHWPLPSLQLHLITSPHLSSRQYHSQPIPGMLHAPTSKPLSEKPPLPSLIPPLPTYSQQFLQFKRHLFREALPDLSTFICSFVAPRPSPLQHLTQLESDNFDSCPQALGRWPSKCCSGISNSNFIQELARITNSGPPPQRS